MHLLINRPPCYKHWTLIDVSFFVILLDPLSLFTTTYMLGR